MNAVTGLGLGPILTSLAGAGAAAYYIMKNMGKEMDLYDHYYKIIDLHHTPMNVAVRHGPIEELRAPAFENEIKKYSDSKRYRIVKYKKLNRARVAMMKRNYEQATKDLDQLRFEKRRAIEALVFGK